MNNATHHETGAAVFCEHKPLIVACFLAAKNGNVHQRSSLTDLPVQTGHGISCRCADINIEVSNLAIEIRLLREISMFAIDLTDDDIPRYTTRCLTCSGCIHQIGLRL